MIYKCRFSILQDVCGVNMNIRWQVELERAFVQEEKNGRVVGSDLAARARGEANRLEARLKLRRGKYYDKRARARADVGTDQVLRVTRISPGRKEVASVNIGVRRPGIREWFFGIDKRVFPKVRLESEEGEEGDVVGGGESGSRGWVFFGRLIVPKNGVVEVLPRRGSQGKVKIKF